MGFTMDVTGIKKGLKEAEQQMISTVETYGRTAAMMMQTEAMKKVPWTEHSYEAKRTITAVCDWNGDKLRVGIAGNKNYSPYLEFANGKSYAHLYPTMHKMSPQIVKGFRNLIK